MSPSSTPDQSHLPSHDRVVPGSVNLPPAPWPRTAPLPSNPSAFGPSAIAAQTVTALNTALANADPAAVAALFLPDSPEAECSDSPNATATGFWRDHLVLTLQLRTLKGAGRIRAWLEGLVPSGHLQGVKLAVDESSAFRAPHVVGFRPAPGTGEQQVEGVAFFLSVTGPFGSGRGVVRMVHTDAGWRVWTLFTTLEALHGVEEARGPRREVGVQHGAWVGRKSWEERRREEVEFVSPDGKETGPEVLIIGAGQAGLSIAARFKMLGVSALAIDCNAAVGDNWRKRYAQLVLHDPVWYDHMPYIPFPDSWPVFTPKDKLADWFEFYAKALDLNVWMSTSLSSCKWDDTKREWTVTVNRVSLHDGQVQARTFYPKHIVLATGQFGKPNMPQIPGMETFQGDMLCHSAHFAGAKQSGNGRKAIVIGACNSGMDICQEFFERGYDVTVVQRSSTCVPSSPGVLKITFGGLYEEGGPPVEDSDISTHGWPSEVLKSIQVDLTRKMVEHDKEMLDGLEEAGFKTDTGPHGAGIFAKYLQKASGYYIDVGGAKLICEGKIKVKQGQEVVQVLPRGLRFADDTELEADEIVFATGYGDMRTIAKGILGDELTDKVGGTWGWDEEGEMRTLGKESGHPGIWFHGGNLAFCRYYSRLLALRIKAGLEGFDDRA